MKDAERDSTGCIITGFLQGKKKKVKELISLFYRLSRLFHHHS